MPNPMRTLRWLWRTITLQDLDAGALKKAAFVSIALLLGILTFETIRIVTHQEPPQYIIESPSVVISEGVTLDDSSISILGDRCSTYDEPVAMSFDTVWLYYASLPDDSGGVSSAPGTDGFSVSGIVVDPGGSLCEGSDERSRVGEIPLGDMERRAESGNPTARGGGMFPGYWSMSSRITISECLEFEDDPSADAGRSCSVVGEELETLSWYSDVFEITEGSE
jgi:hypothetical protein